MLQVLIWLLPLCPYGVTRLHCFSTQWWRQTQSFSAGWSRWGGEGFQQNLKVACCLLADQWQCPGSNIRLPELQLLLTPVLLLDLGKPLCDSQNPSLSGWWEQGAGCLLQVCTRLGLLLQSRFLWEMSGGYNSVTVCSTSWAGGQDVQQNVQDTHMCISMWKKTHIYMYICVYNACLKEWKKGDAASSVWGGNVPRAYRLCLASRYHSYKSIC